MTVVTRLRQLFGLLVVGMLSLIVVGCGGATGNDISRGTTLTWVRPTIAGSGDNRRVGFAEPIELIFPDSAPEFSISDDVEADEFNITRMFFCKGEHNFEVDLWVPVEAGPYAQARLDDSRRGGTENRYLSSRPLADGVYCLHSGTLSRREELPAFSVPFAIRGWGEPEIDEARIDQENNGLTLNVPVNNSGLGEFNDGFMVITLQKVIKGKSKAKFQDRRHAQIEPIAPGEVFEVVTMWDTSDWEPGNYYFSGHVNYQYLYDANSLAVFKSPVFEIGSANAPTVDGLQDGG